MESREAGKLIQFPRERNHFESPAKCRERGASHGCRAFGAVIQLCLEKGVAWGRGECTIDVSGRDWASGGLW